MRALKAMVLAPLFHAETYKQVGRDWKGIGLRYLLLLLAITWLPVLVKGYIEVKRIARDEVPKIASTIPPMTISKGVLSSPVPQPYYYNDPKSGQLLFILDTTGQVTTLQNTSAAMLLTSSQMEQRQGPGRPNQFHAFAQFPDMTINQANIQWWADKFVQWFLPITFFGAMFGSLIWRLTGVLLLGLIGMIFNSNSQLSYAGLMRIAAVSMTATILGATALDLAGIHVPYLGLICTGINLGYLVFGVLKNEVPPSAQQGFQVSIVPPPASY